MRQKKKEKSLKPKQRVKYSLKKAGRIIFFSTLMISGGTWVSYYLLFQINFWRSKNPDNTIKAILQTGPEWEALKSVYLAEVMDLSTDKPTPFAHFNVKLAQKKLMQSPVIKKAYVKKIKPNTVYVDYEVRHPIALVGDYSNTAIDEEGILFPTFPFFSPKKLPEIYFGPEVTDRFINSGMTFSPIWGLKIEDEALHLAFKIRQLFFDSPLSKIFHLVRIDVSQAFEKSYGKRQIILVVEDLIKNDSLNSTQRIVRLNAKNYAQGLDYFFVINQKLLENKQKLHAYSLKPMIIDLRLPQVGYISKLE